MQPGDGLIASKIKFWRIGHYALRISTVSPEPKRMAGMRETTFTELRKHSKSFFDAVEKGEAIRVYRNGRPVADIVQVKAAMPAWKKPPQIRLSLGSLSLGDAC
jgi:antitoxin (DNA-binding transcriptional repressor) of toxin-antitoxin stability system